MSATPGWTRRLAAERPLLTIWVPAVQICLRSISDEPRAEPPRRRVGPGPNQAVASQVDSDLPHADHLRLPIRVVLDLGCSTIEEHHSGHWSLGRQCRASHLHQPAAGPDQHCDPEPPRDPRLYQAGSRPPNGLADLPAFFDHDSSHYRVRHSADGVYVVGAVSGVCMGYSEANRCRLPHEEAIPSLPGKETQELYLGFGLRAMVD